MKAMASVLLVAMMAPYALAGLDPATDSFGVYFDTAGNTNCVTASAFQVVPAYLVLMNPSGPTSGFECSVFMTGAPHFVLSATNNSACGNPPDWDMPPEYYGCAGPSNFVVPANGAVVLVSWQIMLQAPSELQFRIGPAGVPALPGGLPVLVGDGVLRLGAVASGDVNLPVAAINAGNCPVSAEVNAFGRVKSLFR